MDSALGYAGVGEIWGAFFVLRLRCHPSGCGGGVREQGRGEELEIGESCRGRGPEEGPDCLLGLVGVGYYEG